MNSDEQHELLIRIDERGAQTKAVVDDMQEQLKVVSSHDREIALLKQAQESERKYQDLKNQSFDQRLAEQARLWADNDSEHAGMMKTITAINKTLSEARGGGRVIYWVFAFVAGIGASLIIFALTH
jgi:hypothetical protein